MKSPVAPGFTMAEILLSLTIIGVVAAITLPSLTGNISERTWNTQRKALYARFSQAIALMPALNGYGTLTEDENGCVTADTAAETFVTAGLSKVLKINNICDNEHLADCGIPSTFVNISNSKYTMPVTLYEFDSHFSVQEYYGKILTHDDLKAAAFETNNGESIVVYYNRNCLPQEKLYMRSTSDKGGSPIENMCVNFIYDLNGTKGPNTVGKDIGAITVFNSVDPVVVAPMPLIKAKNAGTYHIAREICSSLDPESRVPNVNELSAIVINRLFFVVPERQNLISSTSYDTDRMWYINSNSGCKDTYSKAAGLPFGTVRCVKR